MLLGLAVVGTLPAAAQTPPPSRAAAVAPPAAPAGDSIRVLLTPDRETTLASPIPGRIRSLNTSLGSSFGAGQVLIGLECDEPNARLRIAKAELASAVEQLDAKKRMQALQQAGDVEINLALSAAEKARAQVALQQAQVSQCSITAPWSGRAAKVHVRSHMSVTAGQPLVDLVKAGTLGKKTGKGIYDWSAGRPTIDTSNPTTEFDATHMVALQVNEATKLLEEGVTDSPADIDLAIANGGGGIGPFTLAKGIGYPVLVQKCNELADKFGVEVFRPTKTMQEGKIEV